MKTVFGPVPSRRLGLSLGVDLVPAKTCSFDCLYCECGRTTDHTLARRPYIPAAAILDELAGVIKEQDRRLDFITLSGAGEPTLNSELGRVVAGIKELTETPLAILTNSSLLWLPEVIEDLRAVDVIVPSLDSAVERTFRRIDRPCRGVDFDRILAGLYGLREAVEGQVWLEILFLAGINDTPEEVAALKEAIKRIDPHKIQLNTVDRPPPDERARRVDYSWLERLAAELGPRAEVAARPTRDFRPGGGRALDEAILELIDRRPCTRQDLVVALGKNGDEIDGVIETLLTEGRIRQERMDDRVFLRGVPTEV